MDENEKIPTIQEFLDPSYCKEECSRIFQQTEWLTDVGVTLEKMVTEVFS